MKLTYALSLLASITAVAAVDLTINYLSTSQPSPSSDSYSIALKVHSEEGCGFWDAYCSAQWTDDSSAPFGEWVQCVHNSTSPYQDDSGVARIAFKLDDDFTIENFGINFSENYTRCNECTYTSDSAATTIITPTNSSGYHCEGNTCITPSTFTGIDIFMGKQNPLNCSAPVQLSFPILQETTWGDNLFVVGNISELGNWDPYNAIGLSTVDYTDANPLWNGAYVIGSEGGADDFVNVVIVDSGTAFEWKYIEWTKDGELIWECGENRVYTVIDDRTNEATVGDNPSAFRFCDN